MKERWRTIFNGYYEVSDLGRIRRLRPGEDGRTYRVGRLLKCSAGPDGYIGVCLHIEEGKQITRPLHLLVSRAFLGSTPRGKEVNHIDGVKKNCELSNLEFLTTLQNHKHASRMGLKASGERHGRAKLTWKLVRRMRRERPEYSISKLARRYKVSEGVVCAVIKNRTWKELAA